MAEPTLTFSFSHDTAGDTPWGFTGMGEDPNMNGFKEITPATDLVVFTGGGILVSLPTPTVASGTRDATIRPSVTSYIIPQTYVEKDDMMYIANNVGQNSNRYAMAVYIKGEMSSDLYAEAWDSNDFSTTNLEILQGTPNSGNNSFINAIRTTGGNPGPAWTGSDGGAAYLRGETYRIRLKNESTITDDTVYYNIYVRLPTDCSTFHVLPIIGFRYLYT